MAALIGYNIAFKLSVGSTLKTLAGRTQDDLTIAAKTKESLTKDDQGSAQVAVVGHDITFRASGLVDLDSSTAITRDDLVALVLAKGDNAIIPFKYLAGNGQAYEGDCIITNYSESSNASDDATYTVDFRVTGEMTEVS